MKNISFGGALVHTHNLLNKLTIGDKCNVCLNGELDCEFPSKVTRVESANIALEFIGRQIMNAVSFESNNHF